MDVGKQIKKLRISAGLTQQQLAYELRIGTSTLSGYEVGRRYPDPETLCKIADYFNVTTDYLLSRKK